MREERVGVHLVISKSVYERVIRTAPRVFGRVKGSFSQAVEEALLDWLEKREDVDICPHEHVDTNIQGSLNHPSEDVNIGSCEHVNISPQLDPPLTDEDLITVYQEALSYISEQYADRKLPDNVTVTLFIEGMEKALGRRGIKLSANDVLDRFHKAGWIEPFLKMREPIDWPNAVMIKIKEREPRKIPKELPL